MFKHLVLIAIGIANVSANDVTLNDGQVASIMEEAPRKNLRSRSVTATINDSDVSTESVGWLAAAHRMLLNKKQKNKLTAAQKKANQLAKKLAAAGGVVKKKGKKNNGKNGNKNKTKVKNPATQLVSERAECTDRGNKKWCTNDVSKRKLDCV